jgi:hypothetical protein
VAVDACFEQCLDLPKDFRYVEYCFHKDLYLDDDITTPPTICCGPTCYFSFSSHHVHHSKCENDEHTIILCVLLLGVKAKQRLEGRSRNCLEDVDSESRTVTPLYQTILRSKSATDWWAAYKLFSKLTLQQSLSNALQLANNDLDVSALKRGAHILGECILPLCGRLGQDPADNSDFKHLGATMISSYSVCVATYDRLSRTDNGDAFRNMAAKLMENFYQLLEDSNRQFRRDRSLLEKAAKVCKPSMLILALEMHLNHDS